MRRIKLSDIEKLVVRVNSMACSPAEPYTETNGKYTANVGNYHTYQAYGAVGLNRMVEGGGTTTVIPLSTKREVYNQLHTLLTQL